MRFTYKLEQEDGTRADVVPQCPGRAMEGRRHDPFRLEGLGEMSAGQPPPSP